MSIAKIKVNNSARATFRYAINKEGAQIIGGNAAPWVSRDELSDGQMKEVVTNATQKFMVSINLNDRVEKAVGHISVSFPPGEDLDDEQLSDYCEKYFAAMILTADRPELLKDFDEPEFRAAVDEFRDNELHKYTYSIVRHTDQPHPHAHIVYSRINLETEKAIGKEFERYRSQDILRDLERQYSLTVVPSSWEVGRRAEEIWQIEKEEETGEVSVQKQLQTEIEAAAIDSPTMPELIERLHREGIGVKIDFTRTGKQKGISYTLDNVPIAGNKLGSRYSFPGLSKHLGVDYEAARDNDLIVELCSRVVKKKEVKEVKTGIEPGDGDWIAVTPPDELGDSSGLGNSIDPDPDPDIDSTTDDEPPAGAGDVTTVVPPLVDDALEPIDNMVDSTDIDIDADDADVRPGADDATIIPPDEPPPQPVEPPIATPLTPEQQEVQDKYDQVAAKIRAETQNSLSDEQVTERMSLRFHRSLKPNQLLTIDHRAVLSRSPIVQRIKATDGVEAAKRQLQAIVDLGFKQAQKQRGEGR